MDDVRVVDRVHDALKRVTDEVLVSANDPDAARWLPGLPVVADQRPGTGGLAGVHAALEHANGGDVLVVAWDMPFVTAPLLELVRDRFIASGADACVPESGSRHGIEPFCACYSARVGERLAAFLAVGGAARDFLERCTVARVPLADIARLGDPERLFLSVNDRADLARARGTRD